MASYAAVPVWSPMPTSSLVSVAGGGDAAAGPYRLTRRGRLVRALLVLAVLAVATGLGLVRLMDQPARAAAVPSAPVATAEVVVAEGDSLWLIAQRTVPGTDPREVVEGIRSLNGLQSTMIHPGQTLLVPTAR